jgi:hypothetical protein
MNTNADVIVLQYLAKCYSVKAWKYTPFFVRHGGKRMDVELDLKMLALLHSSVSVCLIAHYDSLKN